MWAKDLGRGVKPRAWTLGYEGLSAEGLFGALEEAHIETLVDVRERPQSRKPGFSKNALARRAAQSGRGYVHIGALGTPPATREAFRKDGDWAQMRREYLRHLKGQGESLAQLKGLIGAGRCALLCYERDAADCHRSILCAELEKEGYVFTHLRPASPAKPARSSGAKLSDFA